MLTVDTHENGLKTITFGYFGDLHTNIEKFAKMVKKEYNTHACKWDSHYITFWVIDK